MKKANVEKLRNMMADFLQYKYHAYLMSKAGGQECADIAFAEYMGACTMVQAIGGEWRRDYNGKDTKAEYGKISNYSHYVFLPSDSTVERMNGDNWKL